ncbi:uncharacterized protein LOC109864233 [Pseudomyrmex gracilis]|uniref:uncharacterized protein LOC109864233 n=1 Tax=Pseudomyrmex gracilis TaxID=219809 RepID=UPI00099528C1|nr:uncharacterized protein LOC109864233 [Pseudomyrmex gracilis]
MKIVCRLIVVLFFRQALAGVAKKPPAFSTPVYSNSYLPAAMQVIFHAVEQLKVLQVEETQTVTQSSSATTLPMKDQQSLSTTSEGISVTTTVTKAHDEQTEISQLSSTPMNKISNQDLFETSDPPEVAQHVENSTVSIVFNSDDHEEPPEVNEEMVEINYESSATPETNHELPEVVQETQEFNQEFPEKSEEEEKFFTVINSSVNSFSEAPVVETSLHDVVSQQQSTQTSVTDEMPDDKQKKKKPTIDSIVDEIYGIVKTTSSPFIEDSDMSDESKSVTELSIEKMENIEDEEDETRFTLLGEKVAQVPRPSLNSYLRRTKVPPRPALQQLASLYDALSKDARKQGFARFAGYSNEVLKTLESSAEGGIGPQLKQLLKKVVERNELTRDDAKTKTSQALRDLDDPGSALNMDLRRLLPLRFTA